MIHFEGVEHCSCEKSFEWVITKPEKNRCVWGYTDKLNKNVCGMVKTTNGYSVTIRCPHCGKKTLITPSENN